MIIHKISYAVFLSSVTNPGVNPKVTLNIFNLIRRLNHCQDNIGVICLIEYTGFIRVWKHTVEKGEVYCFSGCMIIA
jgi:hypothetical protein